MKIKQLIYKMNTANEVNKQARNRLVGLEHEGVYFDKPQAIITYINKNYHQDAAKQIFSEEVKFGIFKDCYIPYKFDGEYLEFRFSFYNY